MFSTLLPRPPARPASPPSERRAFLAWRRGARMPQLTLGDGGRAGKPKTGWTCMRFVDVKSKTCGCHEIGWRSMADRRSVGRVPRGARHQARTTRHKLVFGRSCWTLNHDAVIRIGGEAPGRRAHSKPRLKGHVQSRVATTSDRHLQFVMI